MNWLFTSGGQSIGASASAAVLPKNVQDFRISFRIVWSDLVVQGRDSQESSLAPQFESINSLALSLLYGQTITSARNYWKNHIFDYTDLCQQNDVSAF